MQGNSVGSVRLLTALFATGLFLLAAAPAGAALTDSFVTSGKAQARWINHPAAPPGATDTQSIELAVQSQSRVDFDDAAWVSLRGFSSSPPATPPSFLYKLSQTGSSGGSVRLVIRFSDGGYGFLRPVTLTANQWATANGFGQNWESRGGLPCLGDRFYFQMLQCHPNATVTSVEIINDSGWLYNGNFSALIDNVSYGGETFTKAAPPVLGKSVNLKPVSGKVNARQPQTAGSTRPVSDTDRVDGLVQGLPTGGEVDARRGTVRLIAVRGNRANTLQSGKFAGAPFTVGQTSRGRGRGVTTLRLRSSSRAKCTTTTASRSSADGRVVKTARRRRGLLRRLRGNARGRFRTRGRYSSAATLGTRWSMSDRCEGTLVRVKKGKVRVRDFRRKRTIIVRAGQSYLAKAPGY